jgi:L-seryl-tRNA(Ser) seleniumtransferase
MLSMSLEDLNKRALRMQRKLRAELKVEAKISTGDGDSQVGSGSVPTERIPTRLLKIQPILETVDNLAKKLRSHTPPVCTRVQKNFVLLDLRTIQNHQDKVVVNALLAVLKSKE